MRVGLDVQAERSVARLRLVGALVALVMGTVLAWGGAGSVGWVLIVLTWLAGAGWVGAFFAARRRVARTDAFYVALGEDALVVALGHAPVRVPWPDVRGIDVDEDRLEVVVRHASGELRLPSVWRDMGPHALADALREAGAAHVPTRARGASQALQA